MKKSKDKFNFLSASVLFLLICVGNTFIFSLIHKHKEENLHFHAENILTKDHTVKVEIDCLICPAFFITSILILNRTNSFFKNPDSILEVIQWNPLWKFKNFICYKLGRSPPSLFNLFINS